MVQRNFEEAAAFGLGGCELRFQSVAQGHQFINFGDNAVLFGKGRETDDQVEQNRLIEVLHGCSDRYATKIFANKRGTNEGYKEVRKDEFRKPENQTPSATQPAIFLLSHDRAPAHFSPACQYDIACTKFECG